VLLSISPGSVLATNEVSVIASGDLFGEVSFLNGLAGKTDPLTKSGSEGDNGRRIDEGVITVAAEGDVAFVFANIGDIDFRDVTSTIGTSLSAGRPMVPIGGVCCDEPLLSLAAANILSIVAAEGLFGRGILLGGPIIAIPDLNPKAVDCSLWNWAVGSAALIVFPTDGSDVSAISAGSDEGGCWDGVSGVMMFRLGDSVEKGEDFPILGDSAGSTVERRSCVRGGLNESFFS